MNFYERLQTLTLLIMIMSFPSVICLIKEFKIKKNVLGNGVRWLTMSKAIPLKRKLIDGTGFPKGFFDHQNRYSLVHEQKSGLPSKVKEGKQFLVLGVESSCDDTAVGIVSSDGKILANVVYSQHKIHENFGGVVPGLAMEEHRSKIDIAVQEALAQAKLANGIDDIDAIAVTKGPGLEICLRIGLRKAQVSVL